MAGPVRRSIALALVGLLAGLGLVAASFWGRQAVERWTGSPVAQLPTAATPAPDGSARTLAGPGTDAAKSDAAKPDAGKTGAAKSEPARSELAKSEPGKLDAAKSGSAAPGGGARDAGPDRQAIVTTPVPGRSGADGPAPAPEALRFDIVRVEPNGDAVVAGRGAPNTVVEMLVGGKPVAKALADPTGQFAIIPPTLPPGSSEIQLRSRTADGRETRSQQTVAVAVLAGRNQKPLVALTAPDAPTVVLSQPGVSEREAKIASRSTEPQAGQGTPAGGSAAAQPARIVSVDAQENGRLFVTGAGSPGASLRLYLNDTLIAPASVGPDGRVTFTIGRGVKPGRYQVRIDQIEPGTGKVRSRAEVPFSVPEPALRAAQAAPDSAEARRTAAAEIAPAPQAGPQGSAPAEGLARTTPGEVARRKTAASKGAPEAAARQMAETTPADPGGRQPAPSPPAAPGATAAGGVFVPEINTAQISRGDNLWRISRRAYGRGERYTVIFDANQNQIRDPDLIYPGQIFVLPADKRG